MKEKWVITLDFEDGVLQQVTATGGVANQRHDYDLTDDPNEGTREQAKLICDDILNQIPFHA